MDKRSLREQLSELRENDVALDSIEHHPILQRSEEKFARQQKMTRWLWVYLVILSTTFLVIGGMKSSTITGVWFGVLACFWMGFGSIYLNQMWHERNRLELRREIIRLELTMKELFQELKQGQDTSSDSSD